MANTVIPGNRACACGQQAREPFTHATAPLAKAVSSLAHALGLEVIAEGVETDEQRAFLLENGCQLYQGYLCGRPMAVSALEALLVHALPGGDAPPA